MRSTHHPHHPHHSLFLSILSTSPEQPGMGLQDPRLPHHRKPPTTCPSPPPNPPKHPATKTGVRACTILHGQDSATSLLRFLMLSDSCRGKLVTLSIQYTTQQSVLETLMNKPLARVRSTRTRAPPFVHAQHYPREPNFITCDNLHPKQRPITILSTGSGFVFYTSYISSPIVGTIWSNIPLQYSRQGQSSYSILSSYVSSPHCRDNLVERRQADQEALGAVARALGR